MHVRTLLQQIVPSRYKPPPILFSEGDNATHIGYFKKEASRTSRYMYQDFEKRARL